VVRQAPATGEIAIAVTPRIGITRSAELPLRFLVVGNGFVSARRYNGPSLK
jgi:3-methyladenine DNA glycosylase Mpg